MAGKANSTIKIKIMHKIAIITGRELYNNNYYDSYDVTKVIDSITDWETVDDDTFKLLTDASHYGNFSILEQPIDTQQFIITTVAEHVRIIKQRAVDEANRKAKIEEQKIESARKRKEKALLKLAKSEEDEKTLLASLLKKHPSVANNV